MAAHKKGQARPGAYTDAKTNTTPSTIHDEYGYLKQPMSDHAGEVEGASRRTRSDVGPVANGNDGFSASLPKK